MGEGLRHFIAFISLGILIIGVVAVPIALARRRKKTRRRSSRRNSIDLLAPTERTE